MLVKAGNSLGKKKRHGLQQLQFGPSQSVNLTKSVIAITLLMGANKLSGKLSGSGLF